MKVIVIGASGYVGSRLVPVLAASGHTVYAAVRDPDRLSAYWWADQVTPVALDVTDGPATHAALAGMDAAVYLVHGMGGEDFAQTDHIAAQNVARAVDAHSVGQVVYVSGLIPPIAEADLSEHLRSRLDVEQLLMASSARVVSLRAAMIVGASSTSFEIMAQVCRRLPVLLIPDWMDSLVDPIAVCDVTAAICAALEYGGQSRSVDLGGGEPMAYAALLDRFADVASLTRPQLKVPLPESLVTAVAAKLIDVPEPTVNALLESLRHNMVANPADADVLLDGPRVPLDDALRRSVDPEAEQVPPPRRDPLSAFPGDPDWALDPAAAWG